MGNGSVAANLAFLPLVVHDPALAWTGSALVQVAIPPHPHEREITATRLALHIWRELVKPHGRVWHLFTLSPPAYTLGSISDNTTRCNPWEYGPTRDIGRISSTDADC